MWCIGQEGARGGGWGLACRWEEQCPFQVAYARGMLCPKPRPKHLLRREQRVSNISARTRDKSASQRTKRIESLPFPALPCPALPRVARQAPGGWPRAVDRPACTAAQRAAYPAGCRGFSPGASPSSCWVLQRRTGLGNVRVRYIVSCGVFVSARETVGRGRGSLPRISLALTHTPQ